MAVTRIMWALAALVVVFSLVNCDTEEEFDALADRDTDEDIDALADRDTEEDIDDLADHDTEEDIDALADRDTEEDIDALADRDTEEDSDDLEDRDAAGAIEEVGADDPPVVNIPADGKRVAGKYASSCTTSKTGLNCTAVAKGRCKKNDHGECYRLVKASKPKQKKACCCRTWYYYYYPSSFWQWTSSGGWVFWVVCGNPPSTIAGRCSYLFDFNKPCCLHDPKCRCRQRWYWVKFLYCSKTKPQKKKWIWRRLPHHCYCAHV